MSAPRLCIIGNSHVACLKLAQARPDSPLGAGPVDFFAASANGVEALEVTEGRYLGAGSARVGRQMRAISGKERIDLHPYDAFVIVGVSLEYRDLTRLFRTCCLFRHAGWQAGRALISNACFRAWLGDLFRFRPAYRLAREIAAVRPSAPILLAGSPFPEAEGFFAEKPHRALRRLRQSGYFEAVRELHRDCAAAAAASVGAALSLPGPETQAEPGFTDPRLNRSPVGLAAARKASDWFAEKTGPDPWHMNPDFGRIRLADIAHGLGLSAAGEARPALATAS